MQMANNSGDPNGNEVDNDGDMMLMEDDEEIKD